jgi:uncharacterized protein YdeI (YjbR/CyaY-like superfamily)
VASGEHFTKIQIDSLAALRDWLEVNNSQTESVWLVSFKKGRGAYVPYSDIVDELLCYGWIDSVPRKLDEDRTMLLISPRRAKSNWSKVNKDKIAKLELMGRMKPLGLQKVMQAKQEGTWDALNAVDELSEPSDLRAALDESPLAREHWNAFPPSARRGILEWIGNAKGAETRQRRVAETAELAAQNIRANTPRQPKGR